MTSEFFIGWDVGGWNCDRNSASRDAIVIMDDGLRIVGTPWRGNLREAINLATTSREWISQLFGLCASTPGDNVRLTLAIDTPLGVSAEFLALISDLSGAGPIGDSASNPYLYRRTERELFERGRGPLSAVKDMIGSQSTKGMHVLSKFARRVERCGVWTDGSTLRVIEAYPAAVRRVDEDRAALDALQPLRHDDLQDARVCALVAYLFATSREAFGQPPPDVPEREGWIWVPKRGCLSRLLAEVRSNATEGVANA